MKKINAEELNELFNDLMALEPLEKACPRCGKPSKNKSNPSGRCAACLKKLAANKKKPGHWQRAQTKADDAKRRDRGANGTAHAKSAGRMGDRKKFVKRFQRDEKKTGEKLSPDRIDNKRGYGKGKNGKSNVRNIKESLNVGRHKVDPAKLAAWKKKLKKMELTTEEFALLAASKITELETDVQTVEVAQLIKEIIES